MKKEIEITDIPKNKWFKARAYWYSYDTSGNSREHGPELIIGIRYEDYVSFIHKGQPYLYEKLYSVLSWELLKVPARRGNPVADTKAKP